MSGLQTEFEFVLPKGYIDGSGTLHRRGIMRLATARDEMDPLRDPRVRDANDPFLTIIVLARVITQLGTITSVTPNDIENLFAADLAFLQDLYGIINFGTAEELAALQATVAPQEGAETAGGPADGTVPGGNGPLAGRRSVVEEVPAGERG
jgi:hypothetical protein